MKAVVAAFNQEKALVGAFSVIKQLHRLIDLRHYLRLLARSGMVRGAAAAWLESRARARRRTGASWVMALGFQEARLGGTLNTDGVQTRDHLL